MKLWPFGHQILTTTINIPKKKQAAKFFTTGGRQTFKGFKEHVTIRPRPSLDKKSIDF